MISRALSGAAVLAAALLVGAPAGVAKSAPPAVSVFPIPGDMVATPQTQIVFRGISASKLGTIQVTGSRSGSHTGVIESDSDGNGGSFVPSTPFVSGEVVTVRTSLNIIGVSHYGVFHFTVAGLSGTYPNGGGIRAPRVPHDVLSFRSRPDLSPATVKILRRYGKGGGNADIFLTPQYGPVQNGPEIVAPNGQLLWFDPLPSGNMASDLEVQQYHGQPVLTWWQGYSSQGMGFGQDMIYNTSYDPVVPAVKAGNGLSADLHEFQITPQGTALITAYYPVYWHRCGCTVFDSVLQEIDIPTGLVLYQWDSLDHVPLSASYKPRPRTGAWDYFHINSIQQDYDGNLVISARNTWAAYKLSIRTGKIRWTLGGKYSTFRMKRGASFAFQHDVEDRARGDHWITVFDDGGGLPNVHSQSRAIELYLSFKNKTAWLKTQLVHSPPLIADFEGNDQALAKNYNFVGWGEVPYFTEYDQYGRVILDGRFVSQTASYRAYRFPWYATPSTPPALVASASNGSMTLYMSWNGATGVASWRALGGSSPSAMQTLGSATKTSFETSITVPQQQYAEVQALDSSGRVIGTSAPVSVG